MRTSKTSLLIILLTGLLSLALQRPPHAMQTETSTNVLIIGHSWTAKSATHLNTLTTALGGFYADQVIHGGYSLQDQWNDPEQMALITAELNKGIYDYAAIMDFAGNAGNENGPQKPLESAAPFVALFDTYGVQTVLLEPWAYITHPGMIGLIASNTAVVADELGILVAPIGDAFAIANAQLPALALTKGPDDSHPSVAGAYLRDLVIYAAIMGKHPGELASEFGVSPEDETALKDIAWQAVQNWQNGTPPPQATQPATPPSGATATTAPLADTPLPTTPPLTDTPTASPTPTETATATATATRTVEELAQATAIAQASTANSANEITPSGITPPGEGGGSPGAVTPGGSFGPLIVAALILAGLISLGVMVTAIYYLRKRG